MPTDTETEIYRAEKGDQLTSGYGRKRHIVNPSSPERFKANLLFFVALGTFTPEEAEVYLGKKINQPLSL